MKKIAFIGLGNMGLPMARNLLKAGHELKVFDLVQAAVDELVAEGAKAANDAHDAVAGVDLVVSMLPASRHVEGLYLGDDGLLAFIRAGTLVLECSTISPTPRARCMPGPRRWASTCWMRRSPAAPPAPLPAP